MYRSIHKRRVRCRPLTRKSVQHKHFQKELPTNKLTGKVAVVTGALSRELGPRNIRVNALNPGMVETEGTRNAGFIGSDFQIGARAPLQQTTP